ncbi:MAG: acyl-CoA dehydrogenase family protein [Chloroflexota bacterium]|nr:acyl-CoA dehydrogenase family protein [Chloroflexota bacterium]
MDFSLSEEQKMLQSTVRKFVREQIVPVETEVIAREPTKPLSKIEIMGEGNYNRLEQMGKELGLWALYAPKEYGGAGLGNVDFFIISRELAWTFLLFKFGGDVPNIFEAVNDEIKESYLLPCIAGEKRWAFAQTEPNAGSDPTMMETVAVKRGDNWILNGTKFFASEADIADFVLLPAYTDKQKKAHGITMFIVDRETPATPGYKVTRLIETIASELCTCELMLEDCPVPETNIIGGPGEGFIMAQRFLEIGARLHHCAWDLGMADRCLSMAVEYAKQRVTFGKPLAERQSIQWMLADSAIEMEAAELAGYYCAWKADQGENVRREAAIAKVLGDEMVGRVTDRAIQIYGGLGLTRDLPLERFYRLVRILRIAGGSMEMMRMLIARYVLRG